MGQHPIKTKGHLKRISQNCMAHVVWKTLHFARCSAAGAWDWAQSFISVSNFKRPDLMMTVIQGQLDLILGSWSMIGIALICGQGLCCLFSNCWLHYQSLCLTFVVSWVPSEDVLYFEHFFLLWIISFIAAPGLGNQVEALARKGSAEFNVSVPI